MYALSNSTIYTGENIISDKSLVIEDDLIKSIIDLEKVPAGIEILDYTGLIIVPGFIDLQIAGAGGYLFSENPTAEALNKIADGIMRKDSTTAKLTKYYDRISNLLA